MCEGAFSFDATVLLISLCFTSEVAGAFLLAALVGSATEVDPVAVSCSGSHCNIQFSLATAQPMDEYGSCQWVACNSVKSCIFSIMTLCPKTNRSIAAKLSSTFRRIGIKRLVVQISCGFLIFLASGLSKHHLARKGLKGWVGFILQKAK